MKRKLIYKYIILLIIGILGFNSCVNDLLEVNPTSELESVYFSDEVRVQKGIAATYAKLCDIYGSQLLGTDLGSAPNTGPWHPIWLLPGDDITADGTGATFETFSGLNSSNGPLDGVWTRMYQLIARCNFMLEKIDEPEIQAVYKTPDLMNWNKGEMLFLRSWAYYKLWDWFRKAPIQDKRLTTIEDAILAPSTGFEMLDDVIESLEEAANLLPSSWSNEYAGRVTKDAAYGLLVKCYTLRACYNNKNTDDYQNAIASFEKISASRQLVIPFGNNFDYRTENNVESLFEFQASHALSNSNAWLDNDFGYTVGQMGAYYHNWDTHWANTTICGPTQKLINAFEPGDPRMNETLSDNPDNLGGVLWWIPSWDKFGGYHMVKYTKAERGNCYDASFSILSANNTRIIRLADVKLTVAEAYLATGNASDALKQVNDIRERARKSTPDGSESAVPANLLTVTMENIMQERMVELAGEEGYRWSDLRRWHAAGYINLNTWGATDFGFNYDPSLFAFDVSKHLLFPIPVSELDRNPKMAESGNNPGY